MADATTEEKWIGKIGLKEGRLRRYLHKKEGEKVTVADCRRILADTNASKSIKAAARLAIYFIRRARGGRESIERT